MRWDALVDEACRDIPPARDEALALLRLSDGETLRLVDAAWRVRQHHHGVGVRVNMLLNAKSGQCPEDCHYCSQSAVSNADIAHHGMVAIEAMVDAARRADAAGAGRFCVAISGRGASRREVERVAELARAVKAATSLDLCVSMGVIDENNATILKESGVDIYNHNLNTSEAYYGEICSTHSWSDRVRTVEAAQRAGLAVCSGVILGMGESDRDVVDMAFALRRVGASSIPVNFLIPVEGTPLGDGSSASHLSPWACLRALSVFRLVNPAAELRASAGREVHLRSLQPLALMVANSLFIGGYLTEDGQDPGSDWRMLEDLGLEPVRSRVRKFHAAASIAAER
jgi:biotin synthase